MPGESSFQRMQEEATRRMREMQSRSHGPNRPSAPREEPKEPVSEETPIPAEEPVLEPQRAPARPGSALEALFQDGERTVILALLLLLSNEGDHHELMFALMFLLL